MKKSGLNLRAQHLNLGVSLLMATGCAAPLRSSADVFAGMSQTVHERSGQTPLWRQAMDQDPQTQDKIHGLVHGSLSEEDAIALAMLNSPSLQGQYELLALAHADGVIKTTLQNPLLTILGRFPSTNAATIGETNFLQSLLDIFLLPWRREQANIALERARLEVAQAVLDVVRDVRLVYYRLQAATQITQLQQAMLQELRASSELAEVRTKSRYVDDVNLALGRATYQQAKLDLTRQELETAAALEALLQVMGLESASMTWRIPVIPAPPVQERPLNNLADLSLQRRLDLAADQTLVTLMAKAADLTRSSSFVGTTLLGAAVTHDSAGATVAGPTLVLELPLFNRHQGNIAALEASWRRAQQAVAQDRVKVLSEVRQAERSLLAARSVIEPYTTLLVPLRRTITELTVQQLNVARQGAWDVVLARQNELQTQCERVKAMQDYWTARAQLEHAVGTSLRL